MYSTAVSDVNDKLMDFCCFILFSAISMILLKKMCQLRTTEVKSSAVCISYRHFQFFLQGIFQYNHPVCFRMVFHIFIKPVSLSHTHPNLPILFLHIKHKRMLLPPLRIFLLLLIPFLPFLNETIVDQILCRESCLHRFVIIVKKTNIIALSLEADVYAILNTYRNSSF